MAEGTVERTLVLVKPDGVRRGLIGEILGRLERKQLRVVAAKLTSVSSSTAETHYAEHKGKPFYPGLVTHITSAPVFAVVLEGRSAISVVRLLTGATNPQSAAPGTVRGDYSISKQNNLVHGSDSSESADREIGIWFNPKDLVDYELAGNEWISGGA